MRSERATEKFVAGYNCAQAVLWAFSDGERLDSDTALRIASGFGAGLARRQDLCGALAGGVMALGLRCGRGENEDAAVTSATYAKVQELLARFEAEHGSCTCRELLDGCDITTDEGRQAFTERDLLNRTCKLCVQTAVRVVEELS